MTGHLLGAAGGVEAVISALTIYYDTIAPTINLDNPDPECDLDYVPHKAKDYSELYPNEFIRFWRYQRLPRIQEIQTVRLSLHETARYS